MALVWSPSSPRSPSPPDDGVCASDRLPGPLPEYPTDATTGVPPGTRLKMVRGDYHTSSDGEVIDRLHITGRLYVDHDDVTVKCTRVRKMTVNRGTDLRMWLSTLGDPNGVREGAALKSENYTLRRVEILGTFDGLKAEGDVDVRDSYIHDLFRTRDRSQDSGMTHNDGVQIDKGSDMVFKHNTFYGWSFSDGERAGAHILKEPYGDGSGYMTSAFMIAAGRGDVKDVLIEDNLIRGRTSKPIIAVEERGKDIVDLRIIDNVLGRENRDYPQVFAVVDHATVKGNVFLDGDKVRR